MDNLKKKKVSDGIRRSVIKKKINHISNDGINNTKEGSNFDNNHSILSKKKEERSFVINEYVSDATSNHSFKKRTRKRFSIKNSKKIFKIIVFIFIYCFILFFIFSKLEKTKVLLTPSIKKIVTNEIINAHTSPSYGNLGINIMMLSRSREKNIKPDNKVYVSEKASGVITVFNNYSTEAQRLSPETRFKSVSGKVFKLGNEWVEIPGKNEKGPGSIEVTVYAEEPGPEYNIEITDFTIPGFKEAGLTAKYNDIYALSLKRFTGGFNGEKNIISDSLKKETINDLENQLKQVLMNELSLEKTDRAMLVDNSVQILFKEPSIQDDGSGNMLIKQEAQIFALLIEKNNLEEFLRNKYLHGLSDKDVHLLNFDNISFDYKGSNIDYKKLKNINLDMKAHIIFEWNIDENLVLDSLVGLNKDYIFGILREFDEIDHAEVKIQPFWQKHISNNRKDISIEINKTDS